LQQVLLAHNQILLTLHLLGHQSKLALDDHYWHVEASATIRAMSFGSRIRVLANGNVMPYIGFLKAISCRSPPVIFA